MVTKRLTTGILVDYYHCSSYHRRFLYFYEDMMRPKYTTSVLTALMLKYSKTEIISGERIQSVTNHWVMATTHPLKAPQQRSTHREQPLNVSNGSPVNRRTKPRKRLKHAKPSGRRGKKTPLGVASGLRISFVATSVSCPCGFTHFFYYSGGDTTEITHKHRRFNGLLPGHNCFHSIPRPGTGSGSFLPELFCRQGFPLLIAFVALPSYIPLHFSPLCPIQRGEAVMLCRERGSPAWHYGVAGFRFTAACDEQYRRRKPWPVIGWKAGLDKH